MSKLSIRPPRKPLLFIMVLTSTLSVWQLSLYNFSDSDARSIFSDCLEEELLGLEDKDEGDKDDEERTFCSRASNTEPHYLSIKHWHSAEWKTDRKPSRELRVQSAPLKVKAVKAYYYDYSKE